jgi:hypothetical protein
VFTVSNSNLEETTHLSGGSGCCRNCGTVADGKFCPACGQETILHVPSAGEFIHELVGHFIAVERSVGRTLGLLKWTLGVWLVLYLPLAMHNVFGGGRFGTVWRWLVLILAYSLSLLVSIAGMLALATIA